MSNEFPASSEKGSCVEITGCWKLCMFFACVCFLRFGRLKRDVVCDAFIVLSTLRQNMQICLAYIYIYRYYVFYVHIKSKHVAGSGYCMHCPKSKWCCCHVGKLHWSFDPHLDLTLMPATLHSRVQVCVNKGHASFCIGMLHESTIVHVVFCLLYTLTLWSTLLPALFLLLCDVAGS